MTGPGQDKIDALSRRMARLGMDKKDIRERFVKSSGRGGQKVNKTASAAFVQHLPTGISVKCGSERSQRLNRFLALRRLVEKLEHRQGIGTGVADARLDKIRRRKKKRRKRAADKYGTPASG